MKDSNANNQNNEQILDLSSKSITDAEKIFQEILKAYPNIEQLDLSDNKLLSLPENLSMFKSLRVLDLRMNPFQDLDSIISSLTTIPNLISLSINLSDENQVKAILDRLPNIEELNGKSTREPNEDNEDENEGNNENINENNDNINNENNKINNTFDNNRDNIINENNNIIDNSNNLNNINNDNNTNSMRNNINLNNDKYSKSQGNNINTNNINNNLNNVENEQMITSGLIDLEDEEIKSITLVSEVPNFNEIYKSIAEKLESIKKVGNLRDEFESLIKEKINKINLNYETVPNYIYSTNVLESQLGIYDFFLKKFLVFLSARDPNSSKLCKMISDNITKSYLILVKIIYKLQTVIEDKTQLLKNQLDSAILENQKLTNDILSFEQKMKEISREKDLKIMQLKDQLEYFQTKNAQLDNENKVLTQKFLQNSREILGDNDIYYGKKQGNKPPRFSTPIPNNSSQSLYRNSSSKNNFQNIDNSLNNQNYQNYQNSNIRNGIQPNMHNNIPNNMNNPSYYLNDPLALSNTTFCNSLATLQNPPVCNRVFTINMMKEVMNNLYNSKAEFDRKSDENRLPHETLEQHMYTYLNQKYGLKSMIIEWASNIINGIKVFSCEDSEICLFGKILRNEIEENARFIYPKLVQSVTDFIRCYLKNKHPFKSEEAINDLIKQRKTQMIPEEEWTSVISYLYDQEDCQILNNKILDVIQKKYYKSRLDTDRKLTREEIIKLSQMKEEMNIPFDDLIKILHEFQVKGREKYLKNFVCAFKRVDKDNNGIIDEEEFINLLCNLNIFGDQIKEKIVEILTQIDPYNNKQITFSECVNLFSQLPYYDENGNMIGYVLDRICIPEEVTAINNNNAININNMNNNAGNLTLNNNGINDDNANNTDIKNNNVNNNNMENVENREDNIENNNN